MLVSLEKKEVMEPQRVAPGFFLLLMVYTAQLVANHDSTAAQLVANHTMRKLNWGEIPIHCT